MPAKVRSYAKINIGLCIGPPGMRADGFHELRTVYQTIALHDVVTVEVGSSQRPVASSQRKTEKQILRGGVTAAQNDKSDGQIEIVCNDPRVPTDDTNTCWKAAERMMEVLGIRERVRVTIDKRLPVQGGLGAASSNAVATMVGIEREWTKFTRNHRRSVSFPTHRAIGAPFDVAQGRLRVGHPGLDPTVRMAIAEDVGSDVPLFLIGGTVMGIGRGEQVFPLPDLPELDLVVATPAIGVSTPAAFAEFDRGVEATGSAVHRGPSTRAHDVRASFGMTGPQGESALQGLTQAGQLAKLNTFSRAVYAWLYGSPVVSGVSARRGNRAEALLLDLVRTGIANDFEPVVFGQFPELRKVKSAIEQAGSVYASLSGSGSTVYGMFPSRTAAERAAARLRKQGIPAVASKTVRRVMSREL
jgi:4-diphosphocytidyl-2-C-methyl-D-erythritol kinase